MIPQAREMEKDHGPEVARDWLARMCSPEACETRRSELDPMRPRIMRLFRLLSWVDASPAMLPALMDRLDAGMFNDLIAV